MSNCQICKRELNQENDPTTEDCGGDCLKCMASAGDPECIKAMTEIEFRILCRQHDLTYEYSDSGETWRRGNASLAKVQSKAKELDRETAVRIWNEVVDTKLIPEGRSQFHWKV